MLQRNVATGSSRRYAKGSQWLLLTPMASWNSLDLAEITSSMPELHLRAVKLRPWQEKPQQIAIGRIQDVITYQTCLTQKGGSAFGPNQLGEISASRRQDFLRTLMKGRLPSSPKPSAFCLLVTTNSPSLLNGSAESKQFLTDLTNHTQWPL